MTAWEKCVAFHGHACGGLAIGFKASLLAMDLLDIDFSDNEAVVCISENDACGVDAIQAMLGCSVGKGNLLFHMTGKQAFNIYDRATGKSVRLVLKPKPLDLTPEQSASYYHATAPEDLFDVKETRIPLPRKAINFASYNCDCCGEKTGANWIRLSGEKKLCLDCYETYNRFDV